MKLLLLPSIVVLLATGCDQVRSDESGVEKKLINDRAGSFRNVGIGAKYAAALKEFGEPADHHRNDPLPLAGARRHPSGWDCTSPRGKRRFNEPDVLAYDGVTFIGDEGFVCGWVTGALGAATSRGVAVGDPLEEAKERYRHVECGEESEWEEPLFGERDSFPVCSAELGARRFIWFGGDPIDSLVMNSEPMRAGVR